jgi:hypothetical protein
LSKILKNHEVNEKNLIEHKILIEQLVGESFEKEDEHFNDYFKTKYF